ncbi:hypothetical protein CCP3SC15_450006 [Gammaproteobacteria bacterium]
MPVVPEQAALLAGADDEGWKHPDQRNDPAAHCLGAERGQRGVKGSEQWSVISDQ